MKNQILGFLFILLQCSLFGQAPIVDTITLSFEQETYRIQYPHFWTIDTSHQMATEFILYSPQRDTADLFKENINLIIQDFGENTVSLDEYVYGTSNSLANYFKNSKMFLSERKKANNLTYHQLIYQGTMNNRDLKFEQYLWIQNNKAYVLTLTCE